ALLRQSWALGFAGAALAFWLMLGTAHYVQRMRAAGVAWRSSLGLRHLATMLAHGGFAVFILGLTTAGLFKHTYDTPLDARAPMA
ncbi:cytochrome c-type biogenesis CcmF C-terminal domain-containing protein, partial [Streptomyces scabiei]|uniref:cytochrome c-type biogenesis CcmF C-terminal domain-containing protein n=1 Tax=Streptomyces scabiei TaxID=1930 RepID=UPI0038F7EB85